MRFAIRMLVGSALFAAACAAAAGTVNVSFVNAGNYWDAGNTSWDEEANLKVLAGHLRKLGQRWLPADQVLTIDVLQVDLAGTVRPFHRDGTAVRVITGGADWPRMQMRYSLESGGKVIASGQEWVSDMNYTRGLAGRVYDSTLYYETRMLDVWFRQRFVDALAAPG